MPRGRPRKNMAATDFAEAAQRSAERKEAATGAGTTMREEYMDTVYGSDVLDPNDPDWHRAFVTPSERGRVAAFKRAGYEVDEEASRASGYDPTEMIVMRIPKHVRDERYKRSCESVQDIRGERMAEQTKDGIIVKESQTRHLSDILAELPAHDPSEDDDDLEDQ